MIDATKSPVPTWRRVATMLVLVALIAGAGYLIWVKELHHTTPSVSSPTTAVPAHVAATPQRTSSAPAHSAPAPTTTIPGGVPESSRNPFQG